MQTFNSFNELQASQSPFQTAVDMSTFNAHYKENGRRINPTRYHDADVVIDMLAFNDIDEKTGRLVNKLTQRIDRVVRTATAMTVPIKERLDERGIEVTADHLLGLNVMEIRDEEYGKY